LSVEHTSALILIVQKNYSPAKNIIMAKRVKEPDQPSEVPAPHEPDVNPPTTPNVPKEPDEPEVEPEEEPGLEPEIEPDVEPEIPQTPPEIKPI
jgi:hypothetical protein